MIDRKELESREKSLLSPFAIFAGDSEGRVYPEEEAEFRTCFQRDRDRIIHSRAFRRLEYKTQVFVNSEGDHYRTRLTHTIEVANTAGAIARMLGLNPELVESIALAHDLGHPPFGHAGEDALSKCMSGNGGFEHNTQSLRIVDVLEYLYPAFPGLNLTSEVRGGLIKHPLEYSVTGDPAKDPKPVASFESHLVDLADAIAYVSADLEDGLRSGLLSLDELREVKLIALVEEQIHSIYKDVTEKHLRYQLARLVKNHLINDLAFETDKNLQGADIAGKGEVLANAETYMRYSQGTGAMMSELRAFLYKNFYNHFKVLRMQSKSKMVVTKLFEAFRDNPGMLPPRFAKEAESLGVHRVVCDYVSGMTDRFAQIEYGRLFDPFERV
ncbi:MAG: deoxyguanosinetriphosphate triphosphohydrolase [Planctomycetes bacterium]|nr:deoxyguanosinetriphosphate triphosphohydrolase [Planctomycetota bacterium]